MSQQNAFRQWFVVDGLDVAIARLGVVACLLLLGLRLLTSQVLLVIIPVATGIGCLLYLASHRRRQGVVSEYPTLPPRTIRYLPAGVLVGLAGLVVLLRVTGTRTLPIYLLTGAIGSAILGQALFAPDDELAPGVVLAQVIVAAVVIRFSVLFATPGFIGVDVWTHVPDFVAGIVEAGSLSAIAESKYIMAPFYHAIGAAGTLVFGSARAGTYLTVGLLVPLSALFVYSAASLVVPVRWALVATALDNRNDVLTAGAALAGVIGAAVGAPILDPLAALVVAIGILHTGVEVVRDNVNYLVGAAPPDELRKEILRTALDHPDVKGAHDVIAHYVGPEIDVSLHVEVEGHRTLREAHDIESAVVQSVEELQQVDDAFVHVDPKELGEWKTDEAVDQLVETTEDTTDRADDGR